MSTHQPTTKTFRIYPAYCFRVSPTWDGWVRLSAADVHALRTEPEFKGQRIYFHLNHPIRFVCVVGAVVAIDDINFKYTALTIDDGSGATIELKIVRQPPNADEPDKSNTVINNVNVHSHRGVFEVSVDHQQVDIGTVIKAKGTISEFRGLKQVELKRAWIVSTTNEEVQAWEKMATFKKDVLSRPWRLTSAQHKQIVKEDRKREETEKREQFEYRRKKVAHEKKKKAKKMMLAKLEAKLESRRPKDERLMNGSALV
ncbi:hypothetical protein P280DRAFT_515933 [Massarina eburnea CBS 473.64]|uniref:CST complex subunit Stn1 N-terminal domain-containing protein n=1 Tax=Massarina eburnea CBS 473.64 TaxID=1395130 RepID=A0A6A6S6P6_9PLEO|nr:hypothetical protein P280DRAFT_515933 [Massarina eburnea CBS 473.64]